MAKNRNKKKRNDSTEMAVDHPVRGDESQAMETSDTVASIASAGGPLRKLKKGRLVKRSKNVRKMKAVAKAISKTEKAMEKTSKSESKTSRTKIAKNLYD